MSPYLSIENLSKAYGGASAVNKVNFSIEQGEMIALLGPSGCGKTTTLRLLAGFIEATEGRIVVDGQDYTSLPPYRRDMGLVFQSYALFPHMTVAQNITFGLRMRGLKKPEVSRRLDEMLGMVKLDGMGERYPRQLSGGQQQRVALARALAIRPKVLLMDEPLSNLDANLRQSVAREIRQLQKAVGLTALMVTHDQDEAMMMADRLVLMHDGKVQQIGTQRDVYENPQNPFVARFIGDSNIIDGELVESDRFRLSGGVTLQLAGRYKSRGHHTLSLRPERLRIRQPHDDRPALASARISDMIYVGSYTRYYLALSETDVLTLDEPTGEASVMHCVGEMVDLLWDGATERLFTDGICAEKISA